MINARTINNFPNRSRIFTNKDMIEFPCIRRITERRNFDISSREDLQPVNLENHETLGVCGTYMATYYVILSLVEKHPKGIKCSPSVG